MRKHVQGICPLLVGLLLQLMTPLHAQPTELGSIADAIPDRISLPNGSEIQLYSAPRNRLIAQDPLQWSKMRYFYVPAFEPARDQQGRYATALTIGGRTHLRVSFRPKSLDRTTLNDAVRTINGAAANNAASELPYQELTVSLPDITNQVWSHARHGIGIAPGQRLTAQFQFDPLLAEEAAEALNAGAFVPTIRITVIQQMADLNAYNVNLDRFIEASLVQDYFGPSGPQFITAAQEVDIAVSIQNSLREFAWVESPDEDRSKFFSWVFDRMRDPTPIERDLSSDAWTKGLRVDTADLIQFTDEIKAIAYDAKNLDSGSFCREYGQLWEDNEQLTRERGASAEIPIKKVVLGLSGKSDKTKTRHRRSEASESDCGQHFVQNQFSYAREGSQFIPKSIFVYQKFGGISDIQERFGSETYVLNKRTVEIDAIWDDVD